MAKPSQPTQISGSVVIVGIVVLALGAASFSWWFRVQATDQALALWGADRARLIQRGKQVQVLRLSSRPASDDVAAGAFLELDDQKLLVTEQQDISAVRGLLHLRQALLEDRSFDESTVHEPNRTEWAFGLRISDGRLAMLLLFTRDFEKMAVVERGRVESVVSIAKEPTAAGLATFCAEQFEDGQFEEGRFDARQSP